MAILRQPGAWKGPGGLAAAPLLLATIMPLIARIVPQFLVPSLFRFSYTTDELALLVILLAGAAVVASRSFPTWSYTWVVLMFTSLEAFLFSLLPTLLPQDIAPTVTLLASPHGGWITGQVISISGGFSMV